MNAVSTNAPATSLEETLEIKILLVMRTDRRAGLLTEDGQDRLVIQLGIVKPVKKMDGAGPGGGKADRRPRP